MTLYRLVRYPDRIERHLVNEDGSHRKVSDTAVLKDWEKYMRDIVGGSVWHKSLDAQGKRE
jgi:hypothetical protein